MEWVTIRKTIGRIENLALPISPYFLVLALSLGALLGGGLQILSQPSSDFKRTIPNWKQESLNSNGTTGMNMEGRR